MSAPESPDRSILADDSRFKRVVEGLRLSLEQWFEWLLLRRAVALSSTLTDRAAIANELREINEHLRGATALWHSSLRVLAVQHFAQAIDRVQALCSRWPDATSSVQAALQQLRSTNVAAPNAVLVSSLLMRSVERVSSLDLACLQIEQSLTLLETAAEPRWRIGWLRITRMLAVVLSVLLVARGSYEWFAPRITARASHEYSPIYPARYAIDEQLATNWLLPDGVRGWIELSLPAHSVQSVFIWNVQGMENYSTKECVLELFDGDTLVHRSTHNLESIAGTATPFVWTPTTRMRANRLRITTSVLGTLGAGFAQIRVVQ